MRVAALALAAVLATSAVASANAWWTVGIDAPASSTDATVAERAARAFLAQHRARLAPGSSDTDFTLTANHLDRGLRTVTFTQRWRGLRVVDSRLGFVFARDRLIAVRAGALPNVTAPPPARADAAVQRARAEAWIASATGVRVRARATGERVVVAHAGGYRITDVLDARTTGNGGERWDVYVTPEGEPLGRRATVMFGSGKLVYGAGVRYGSGARATYPASAAVITVNGIATTTATDGAFSWTGTNPATVTTAVSGTYVRVVNAAGLPITTDLTVAPAATGTWDLPADELGDAQVSTYVYGSIAKARARIVNPAAITWLDQRFDFFVNEAGSCNAYSNGDEVHLYRGNAMCENTGRVGDVVVHEFGHALHKYSLIAGMGDFDNALSEGLSDYYTATISGDPAIGRGFFRNEEPLRDIDLPGSERVYPKDVDDDTHITGLIIAGALWDLRKSLIGKLGVGAGVARADQIFTGVMQRADRIENSFTPALIADDDDADLTNGTPNYCALEAAFGRHGLVEGYVMTTVATPVVNGRDVSLQVTTPPAMACPPLAVSSIHLAWRTADGTNGMVALVANGPAWTGAFPEMPDGTLLTYTVDVRFDDGSLTRFPNNPADPRYQLFLGEATPLWCESFDTDPAWEEVSNRGFEWQWGPAQDDPLTPDPDAAHSAPGVLGTDLASGGDYRPVLMTALAAPTIKVPSFERIRLQYWRWLTVEDSTFDQAIIEANGTEVWRNALDSSGTLDHIDREWRFHDIDVTSLIAEDRAIQLRWRLDTDGSKQLGGWTIDDVCLVGAVKLPLCGDGEVDVDEQCDDGNLVSDDGCAKDCIDEVTAGGGGGCAAVRTSSWLVLLASLGLLRQRRRRASSLVPSRSVSERMP